MISSSNADFDEDGFSFVVRDLERLYLMLSEYGIEAGDSETASVIRWDGGGYLSSPVFQSPNTGQSNSQLKPSGVVAGKYTFPTLTVDQFGRVTQIQNNTITIPPVAYLGTLTYPVYGNGGNARGTGAVDWQQSRSAVTQVASGNYATIIGGQNCTASGLLSIAGGGSAVANGESSIALSGSAGAQYGIAIGYGANNPSSFGTGSISIGANAYCQGSGVSIGYGASAIKGVSIGYNAVSTQDHSIAIGNGASAGANDYTIAIGGFTPSTGGTYNNIIIGYATMASKTNNIVVGMLSGYNCSCSNGILIGQASSINSAGQICGAIGYTNIIQSSGGVASDNCYIYGRNNTAGCGESYLFGAANTTTQTGAETRLRAVAIGYNNSITPNEQSGWACAFGESNTISLINTNTYGAFVFGKSNSVTNATGGNTYAIGTSQTSSNGGMSLGPTSSSCATAGRLNFGVSSISVNTTVAYNGTFSVRNSAGTGSVALTFTHGILTAVV
jgi:hypothetical protein